MVWGNLRVGLVALTLRYNIDCAASLKPEFYIWLLSATDLRPLRGRLREDLGEVNGW